jgi:hypothetical protein
MKSKKQIAHPVQFKKSDKWEIHQKYSSNSLKNVENANPMVPTVHETIPIAKETLEGSLSVKIPINIQAKLIF